MRGKSRRLFVLEDHPDHCVEDHPNHCIIIRRWLHACSDSREIGENTQAALAELAHFGGVWTLSSWLNSKVHIPLLVNIDPKGL